MTDLMDEAQLRTGLSGLTEQAWPGLEEIKARRQVHSRRRRYRALGVSAGVGAALVLVAAGSMHVIGWKAGSNGEVPMCSISQVTSGSNEAYGLEPGDLPSDLRLGWSTANAPAPAYANARRAESSCAYPAVFRLVDFVGGEVRRSAELIGWRLDQTPADASSSWDGSAAGPGDIKFLGRGQPGEAGESREAAPMLYDVQWHQAGYSYELSTSELTRKQTEELLAHLRVKGSEFDLGRWGALNEFDEVGAAPLPADGVTYSWILDSEIPDGVAVPLALEVIESSESLGMRAEAGDRWVTVAGQPALQERSGMVIWKPTPDTFAFMHGTLSRKRLLEIAQTVEPRPATEFDDISAF
jgi:hypothetical protein